MKRAYRSLAHRFHPDKNKHSQVTQVMILIIKAKENLERTLCNNDKIREEECVRMDAIREEEHVRLAHNAIIILYNDKYNSGISETPSEPVTSSNKAYTFPAENKSDNEETSLKKTHQGPFI